MSGTSFGTNAAQTVKVWSPFTLVEAIMETSFQEYISRDGTNIIKLHDDLKRGAGDRVRVSFIQRVTNRGVNSSEILSGQEAPLNAYSDDILLDTLANAVLDSNVMNRQRLPFDLNAESKTALKRWLADRLDTCFFNQLCGNTDQADLLYTGNNATTAPTRLIFPGTLTAETGLTASTTNSLSLAMIDQAVAAANAPQSNLSPLTPLKIGKEDHFVLTMHEYDFVQLKTSKSASAISWFDVNTAALAGGLIDKNPILTGALGVYNRVILKKSGRISNICNTPSTGTKADYRRPVLAGANAINLVIGRDENADLEVNFVEQLDDYGRRKGVSLELGFGMKKSVENGNDFSNITLATYAPAPAGGA